MVVFEGEPPNSDLRHRVSIFCVRQGDLRTAPYTLYIRLNLVHLVSPYGYVHTTQTVGDCHLHDPVSGQSYM